MSQGYIYIYSYIFLHIFMISMMTTMTSNLSFSVLDSLAGGPSAVGRDLARIAGRRGNFPHFAWRHA